SSLYLEGQGLIEIAVAVEPGQSDGEHLLGQLRHLLTQAQQLISISTASTGSRTSCTGNSRIIQLVGHVVSPSRGAIIIILDHPNREISPAQPPERLN